MFVKFRNLVIWIVLLFPGKTETQLYYRITILTLDWNKLTVGHHGCRSVLKDWGGHR